MDNLARNWIGKSTATSALSACFVDCQLQSYEGFPMFSSAHHAFSQAQNLAHGLRKNNINISHFMLNQYNCTSLTPFQYKDKNKTLIPNLVTDFKIVIPEPDEWVYPKTGKDGFENPHAAEILSQKETILICAGFMSYDCLQATIIGSFNTVSNPKNHKVIVAIDATNLAPIHINRYMNTLKGRLINNFPPRTVPLGTSIGNNITHAATADILTYLKEPYTPTC